jgi:anti-sigma factor RsiW
MPEESRLQCAEALRVQAYFDGEVDAPSAVEVERHAERCAECRALLQHLAATRARMREELEFPAAPAQLRSSIARMLDAEAGSGAETRATLRAGAPHVRPRSRPGAWWLGALGGAGAALAAAMAFFFLSPALNGALLDEVVSAHVRSLMPEHLTDVLSTDRHTVKPWFAGHADVSPVVADYADQGYPLIGGRADYFDRQRVAAVVYRHGAHLINVFAWVADWRPLPQYSTRSGFHIACWKLGNLQYCAISDAGWEELQGLTRLLRASGAADSPH